MKYVQRYFTEIHPARETSHERQRFDAFNVRSAVVVLGDPGIGKTTSLRELAEGDPDGLFISVRRFLNEDLAHLRGRVLYIDALDEQRAFGADGFAVLEAVVSRLRALGRPKFRLSCRAADWYGTIDVDVLRAASAGGEIALLRLEPLTEDEIHEVLADEVDDPAAFIEAARAHGIDDLLVNPETLKLLVAVVRGGPWPGTRVELYERASALLVRESNDVHGRDRARQIDLAPLLDTAGLLCALALCSDVEGFALTQPAANDDFVASSHAPGKAEIKRVVLASRVFHAVEPERVVPVHRTTAEFLAARYLARRVMQHGLPLGRVLALITGDDGGTLTELRGLYAWFTALCTPHRTVLADRDPLGVILYGDVSGFSVGEKEALFASLARLEKQNPYYRAEDWSARPFGALATPDMEPVFRRLLTGSDVSSSLRDCALDALNAGHPMPGLRSVLVPIIRDASQVEVLRIGALRALIRTKPNEGEIQALLDDIHRGTIEDEDRRLRGELLYVLYPAHIPPREIGRYIVKDATHFVGSYSYFLRHELVPRTPPALLPELVDGCIAHGVFNTAKGEDYTLRTLAGEIVAALLEHHGTTVPTDRLYDWLAIGIDEYNHPAIDEDDQKRVRAFFAAHPEIFYDLLRHYIEITAPDRLWISLHEFGRVQGAPAPPGLGQWLLDQSLTCADPARARELFFLAARGGKAGQDPTLEALWDAAERRPALQEALNEWSFVELRENHLERMRKRKERADEDERRFRDWCSATKASLLPQIREIGLGTARGALHLLAEIYFSRYTDFDPDLSPRDRLVDALGPELADSAENGFDALLRSPTLPKPAEAAEAYSHSKLLFAALPLLAGLERLFERDPEELIALPTSTIRFAVAAHLTGGVSRDPSWLGALVDRRPQPVAESLKEFWGALIAAKATHFPWLHKLEDDSFSEVSRLVAVELLERHPEAHSYPLRALLTAALIRGERAKLSDLVRDRISGRHPLEEGALGLWLATAFLLAPDELGPRIRSWVGRDQARGWNLIEFAPELLHKGVVAADEKISATEGLVRLFGPLFPPVPFRAGSRVGSRHPDDAARIVGGLVDLLGADLSDAADDALARCRDDVALAPWHDRLAYVLSMRARKLRDARYRRASFADVAETLTGGPPANAADLQALAVEHLRQLGRDIRDGNLDSYKTFWNLKGQKVSAPVAEEIARDRLVDRLRDKLGPVGIVAEPEAHYAEDKRGDVRLSHGPIAVPIEAKRNYHPDLWAAPSEQLKALYARDPGAADRGIYLVFWFGHARPTWTTLLTPDTKKRPNSARELEQMLCARLSPEDRAHLDVVVIDCSPPSSGKQSAFPHAKATKAAQNKSRKPKSALKPSGRSRVKAGNANRGRKKKAARLHRNGKARQ